MKVKHLERSANVAWSPKNHHPILLATGTAAQQLDASFSTNASLEIHALNLRDPGPDLELKGSAASDHRFHKIIWGEQNGGTIIGGCDGGIINIYSASKIMKGEEGLMKSQNKHTGPVHALDFNPFQQYLFATGASESEIFIWDLNNLNSPMTPGAKTQPSDEVLSIAWNRQVQHILCSTFASKCAIWDLRKNEPIIKLTDTVSRVRWKDVAWHPEVATQLCLASEEDHSPIIQIWDLRFATSPLKTLEHHQRGVLSVSWCQEDSDLLVSCGKDNLILCWNPNSNQPADDLTEIARTNQWIFDIAWCPRNPAIIACPSFDGNVSVYSLMGGKTQNVQTSSKIAESFPGMDGYVQAPVPQQVGPTSKDLIRPPRWLKRPVGASFGFGGRLITFSHDKAAIAEAQHNAQPGQPLPVVHRSVQISQVITEPELVQHSAYLEQVLQSGDFREYCRHKAEECTDQHKKYIWHFLKANFEDNPRAEVLNLLGYKIEDVNNKLSQFVGNELKNNIDGLTDQLSNLNRIDDFQHNADPFSNLSQPVEKKPIVPFKIKTGDDTEGLITQALLLGNVEAAVELCLKAKRFADAIIIAMTGGTDLLARTQHKYLEQSEGYVSSLISALVSEDWGSVINNCDTDSWKEALAATLTHSSDEELPLLCEQLGYRLEVESAKNPKLAKDAQLCYICGGSFDKLVNSWTGNTSRSTKDLQELVELVSFLQKAVERQGRQVSISGSLADVLSHYASILAAQGSFAAAITHLGYSEDPKVTSLRDRLLVNLGQKPAYNMMGRRSTVGYNQESTRFGYKPFQPMAPQPVLSQPPMVGQQQFNTGLPNSGSVIGGGYGQVPPPVSAVPPPPVPMQPARAFSPAVPPTSQPPRPSSVSSNHGSSGLPSRKYVLDPSVSSTPSYNNLPARNMAPIPPMPAASTYQPQPQTYQPQPQTYQPQNHFPAASMPPSNVNMAPPPLSALPPANRFGRVAGSRTQSFSENDPSPDINSNQGPFNFGMGGQGGMYANGKVEVAQNAMNLANMAPPGWNDPPAFSRSSRQQQAKADLPPPEPITHPLFGVTPSNANQPPDMGYPQPYNNMPPLGGMYGQDSLPPVGQPVGGGSFPTALNPGNFNQNAINNYNQNALNSGGFNQGAPVAQAQVAEPAPPVQKAPIPEEHIHMKTVFDALREQCVSAASNPQTKRKLEDVARKLETLYDLLREHALSANTLLNLHQMVDMIQHGNYNGGLQLYMQLASGPDFAQIASFMPGIKILVSSALQLQVYLR